MQSAEGAQRRECHWSVPTYVIGEDPLIYLQVLQENNDSSLMPLILE